jgi:hypothetical protein
MLNGFAGSVSKSDKKLKLLAFGSYNNRKNGLAKNKHMD